MPSDPTKRIENWDAGFDTAAVKTKVDKKRPKMLEHVSSQFPALALMEGEVKQVLDGLGLPVIQYPFYLCYGRELWHITHERSMSGESAAVEAQVLLDKWVARGLVQSALEKIRKDVFNIVAPVAP
jgi:hypothetical protein